MNIEKDIRLKRLEFWEQLLKKSNEKTKLFSYVSPTSQRNYIIAGAGKTGLTYVYCFPKNRAEIEFNINTGSKDRNKKIFDELYRNKQQIEVDFGEELDWLRRDDSVQSRIQKTAIQKGLNDEEDWSTIQDKMVDAMVRLEKAINKHLLLMKNAENS